MFAMKSDVLKIVRSTKPKKSVAKGLILVKFMFLCNSTILQKLIIQTT